MRKLLLNKNQLRPKKAIQALFGHDSTENARRWCNRRRRSGAVVPASLMVS